MAFNSPLLKTLNIKQIYKLRFPLFKKKKISKQSLAKADKDETKKPFLSSCLRRHNLSYLFPPLKLHFPFKSNLSVLQLASLQDKYIQRQENEQSQLCVHIKYNAIGWNATTIFFSFTNTKITTITIQYDVRTFLPTASHYETPTLCNTYVLYCIELSRLLAGGLRAQTPERMLLRKWRSNT